MQSSPESSASTLPRKRSSAAGAPSGAAPAVGINGDRRDVKRDVVGMSVKNRHIPVKKMGLATTVCCVRLPMLRVALSVIYRISLRAPSQPFTLETVGGKQAYRGCEGASSQLKQGRVQT